MSRFVNLMPAASAPAPMSQGIEQLTLLPLHRSEQHEAAGEHRRRVRVHRRRRVHDRRRGRHEGAGREQRALADSEPQASEVGEAGARGTGTRRP